ncbi:hypothetical protein LSAT2_031463 [Lamellibrachia satsuma]|nr:hypothetical protein LSAT2_031463 [Lamellibrachia satsuma]
MTYAQMAPRYSHRTLALVFPVRLLTRAGTIHRCTDVSRYTPRGKTVLVCHLVNDADWLLALHGNEITPLRPDSLLGCFAKAKENRISEIIAIHKLASILQAPRCGATAYRAHLRLDAEWGSHCDGNYNVPRVSLAKNVPRVSLAKNVPRVSIAKNVPRVSIAKNVPRFSLAKNVPRVSLAKNVPRVSLASQANYIDGT